MSGNHRATRDTSKARNAVAGALTAGALLIAPIGAAVVASPAGIAHAAPPGGDPGGNDGGSNNPPPGGGPDGPVTSPVHKKIFRLPFLKVEIKNVRGDHKPPKIKIVPFPRFGNGR